MVAEFVKMYHMTFQEVYNMPACMFFTYYREIDALRAQSIIDQIRANEMVAAMQWSDDKNKRKIVTEMKKLEKLAAGD